MDVVPFAGEHLYAVLQLCEQEGWTTLAADPDRAERALTAPGSIAVVAREADKVLGFAQLLTDGAVEAYLATLVVAAAARGRGVGRRLVEEAFERSGALRVDLLALDQAAPFYESFEHRRFAGFRLYPG